MSDFIIYKDGAYNFFSSISNGCSFSSALTLDQLQYFVREDQGRRGIEALPERLERAHRTGSSEHGGSLESCIAFNRAGPGEACLSTVEFIAKFLTLAPSIGSGTS